MRYQILFEYIMIKVVFTGQIIHIIQFVLFTKSEMFVALFSISANFVLVTKSVMLYIYFQFLKFLYHKQFFDWISSICYFQYYILKPFKICTKKGKPSWKNKSRK